MFIRAANTVQRSLSHALYDQHPSSLRLQLRRVMSSTSQPPPMSLELGKTRIGWIGTGVMGSSMCAHVLQSASPAYPTTVYNRSSHKTASLASLGATVASSPGDVAANSDVLFTIVGFPHDVRSVYFGSEQQPGLLAKLRPGAVVIDMTTSEPTLAQEIAAEACKRQLYALDAPVSGGDIGAREARLSIMCGGDKAAFDAVLPLFQAMGKNITHCGQAGAGQHTKMVNQTIIATSMIGVVEGLLYAHKAGLDPHTTIGAISAGAAGSWSLSNLAPRMLAGNFDPGFYVEHFVKDLGIVLAESRRMNLSLPGLALAYSLYVALMAQGGAKNGTQALYIALARLNGMEKQAVQQKK